MKGLKKIISGAFIILLLTIHTIGMSRSSVNNPSLYKYNPYKGVAPLIITNPNKEYSTYKLRTGWFAYHIDYNVMQRCGNILYRYCSSMYRYSFQDIPYYLRQSLFNSNGTTDINSLIPSYMSAQIPFVLTSYILTPNGSKVMVMVQDPANELPVYYKEAYNDYCIETYPDAILIRGSTNLYNCHTFAWYNQEGSVNYWIDDPQTYWDDGSYVICSLDDEDIPVDLSSNLLSTLLKDQLRISYNPDDSTYHSAISIPRYLVEEILGEGDNLETEYAISKFGAGPLMIHPIDQCPYDDLDNRTYYKLEVNNYSL